MYRALIKRGQAATKGRWSGLKAFADPNPIKCTFPASTEELGSCAPLAMLEIPDLDYSSTPFLFHWGSGYEYHTDPCIEYFSHYISWWEPTRPYLQESWYYDPLTTLKLVCNRRSNSRTGCSSRKAFYHAALWLFKVEPLTLAYNVRAFAEFGSFKDFLVILDRLLHHDSPKKAAARKDLKVSLEKAKSILPKDTKRRVLEGIIMRIKFNDDKKRVSALFLKDERKKFKQLVSLIRNDNIVAKSRRTLRLNVYKHKPTYKLLLDQISELFFQTLKADLEFLKAEKFENISQAAKWCPSFRSRLEHSTRLSERIARRFFPPDVPEYKAIDGHRVGERLWKEVVAPLLKALQLKRKLPMYDIVYSNSLTTQLPLQQEQLLDYFRGRDPEMQKKVVEALLPHEIIDLLAYGDCYCDAVADLKWKRMVSELSEQGKFKNSIAVVGYPVITGRDDLDLKLSLGLLISELSEGPWKGKIMISGHEEISDISVEIRKNLQSKVQSLRFRQMKALPWPIKEMSLFVVLHTLLENACRRKLKAHEMVKRVFVFSGESRYSYTMNTWMAMKDVARERFRRKGFPLPEIVVWDTSQKCGTPEVAVGDGATVIEHESCNVVKAFIESDGRLNLQSVMEAALSGEKYENLKLYGNSCFPREFDKSKYPFRTYHRTVKHRFGAGFWVRPE